MAFRSKRQDGSSSLCSPVGRRKAAAPGWRKLRLSRNPCGLGLIIGQNYARNPSREGGEKACFRQRREPSEDKVGRLFGPTYGVCTDSEWETRRALCKQRRARLTPSGLLGPVGPVGKGFPGRRPSSAACQAEPTTGSAGHVSGNPAPGAEGAWCSGAGFHQLFGG